LINKYYTEINHQHTNIGTCKGWCTEFSIFSSSLLHTIWF